MKDLATYISIFIAICLAFIASVFSKKEGLGILKKILKKEKEELKDIEKEIEKKEKEVEKAEERVKEKAKEVEKVKTENISNKEERDEKAKKFFPNL